MFVEQKMNKANAQVSTVGVDGASSRSSMSPDPALTEPDPLRNANYGLGSTPHECRSTLSA